MRFRPAQLPCGRHVAPPPGGAESLWRSTAPPTRAHPRLFRPRTLLLGLLPGRLQGRLCETRRTMATPTPTGTAAPFKVRTNAAGALMRCRAGLTAVGGRRELVRPRSARPAPDLGCRHMHRRLGAQQGPRRPLATISSGRPWTLAALAPSAHRSAGRLGSSRRVARRGDSWRQRWAAAACPAPAAAWGAGAPAYRPHL